MTEDRLARAGLSRLAEPGDVRIAQVVAQVGAPHLYDDVLARRAADLAADAAGRLEGLDPAGELERAERAGIRYVIPGDPEWPDQLDDLAHAGSVQELGGVPLGLWVRGPVRLDEVRDSVAVVGSRSSTTYGEDVARDLGAGIARAGLAHVSGAAFGIDQASHRGALAAGGVSVAVLACGVDRAYPAAHHALLEHLAGHGAVVSEVPPGCAPLRMRFLARNRIIAGLARGTVLVEAALRSGALNTASWANGLSRPLMGVPGAVTSAQSQGVHQLLRQGAGLVTGPTDVLEQIGVAGEHLVDPPRGPERQRDRLSRRHHQVLEAVPVHRSVGLRALATTAGINLRETQVALSYLAEHGFVTQADGGWRLGERALADLR
ncbi:DNA-processing protein DprA [Nocardioides euryhalodurans]|uniref:DNA-protecting protein DprA n=1 Tax=Nocardioides euryhalodurans TaxID=2518370 RepID=A0A4P7GPB6_9ACTN|nr:DNA-processing protein DprA [Nocardioides euryhalodurans]QBR94088.1 DNA-protecting protein DprA [Nocardioides euryhalodurans]